MNAKPIETLYNGYRFRSRLEARWAVFFDAAGIAYQYEPEGYVGYLGIPYLPDFYLPDLDIYAEVKGTDVQLRKDAEKICNAIDFNATPISTGLILLGELPNAGTNQLPIFPLLYWGEGVLYTDCLFDIWNGETSLVRGDRGDEQSAAYDMELSVSGIWEPSCEPPVSVKPGYINADSLPVCTDPGYINRCYEIARQARFEYGETPTAAKVRRMALHMWRGR
jgi:hypothetical protein